MEPAVLALMMALLEVHTLDGRTVYLNPAKIISIAPPKQGDALWPADATCVISLADRKFLTVRESCESIRDHLK